LAELYLGINGRCGAVRVAKRNGICLPYCVTQMLQCTRAFSIDRIDIQRAWIRMPQLPAG
jgi:hypothetical protein